MWEIKNVERQYNFLALAVIAVMYMMIFRVEDPVGIGWLLLLSGAFFIRPFAPQEISAIDMAMISLWGYTCISCFTGINIWGSLPMVRQVSICLLGYILFRKFQLCHSSRIRFFNCLMLLAGVTGLLAVCSFLVFRHSVMASGFTDTYAFRFLFKPLGYNTNAWATLLIVLAGFVLLAPRGRFFTEKLSSCLMGLILLAILLSFSRGAYVALAVFIGLSLAILPSKREKRLLAIVSVVVAVTCFGFPNETFTTLRMNHTLSQQRSTEGRVDATRIAWEVWKERPLVGAGAGNYTLAADHKLNQDSTRTYTSYAPNPAVLVLVEGGILGMMLFVFLLMAVCRVLVRRRKEKDVLLVGVILLALFVKEMTLSTLPSTPMSMLLASILLAVLQWDKKAEEYIVHGNMERKVHHAIWIAFGLCYVVCVCFASVLFWNERKVNFSQASFLQGDWIKANSQISKTTQGMSYLINQSVLYMELDRRWRMPVFAEETISLLFKAGGRQPEDTHITYLQAKLAWQVQAKDIAFDILRELTQCYPRNVLYRYELYKQLYEAGRKEEALLHLEKAAHLMPRILELDSISYLKQVDSLFYHKLTDNLLAKCPKTDASPDELARYGYICWKYGNFAEAETFLRQAVNTLPSLSTPWFLLGKICKEAGRQTESIQCMKKYYLLEHGAFTFDDGMLPENPELSKPCEQDLMKGYATKFKDWYGSSFLLCATNNGRQAD